MTVIKRDKKDTSADLASALERLIPLLEDQGEHEAAKDLKAARTDLQTGKPGSPQHAHAVAAIIDAFEGDHELSAYMHQRQTKSFEWTEAEELSSASNRVLSLALRMK